MALEATMQNEGLQLIGPEQFKAKYASQVGISAIRELFKAPEFPSIRIGSRYYTTEEAAREYLKNLKI